MRSPLRTAVLLSFTLSLAACGAPISSTDTTFDDASSFASSAASATSAVSSLPSDTPAMGVDKEFAIIHPTSFPGLPVQWFSQSDIEASPTSRPMTPPTCMPLSFSPNDISATPAADGTIHSIKKNGKKYGIVVGDTVAMDSHFSFREYSIDNQACPSKALLIQKDGQWYAFYSHILFGTTNGFYGWNGWSYEPATQKLLIHNISLDHGEWMEKVRVIDLPTKQSTDLPLDLCFIHGTLLPNGLIAGGYMEPKANAPTVQCLAKIDGTLLFKMHPKNVQGTALGITFMPGYNSLGLMLDVNSQVVVKNGVMPAESPEGHRLIVLDMAGERRWATFLFPTNADPGGFDLTLGNLDPEYDLSAFSWDTPTIRYRGKIYDDGHCCMGSWKWSEWRAMTLEKVFN